MTPVLEYHSPGTLAARPLMSRWEKGFLITFGIVLPLICFALCSTKYPIEPDWQSGGWYCYILFVPDGRAGFPFYPLLLFCMGCLGTFVIRPSTSRLLLVRLGLYTGIILALQYTIIQSAIARHDAAIAVGISLATNFILLGALKLLELLPAKALGYIAIGVAVLVGLIALISFASGMSANRSFLNGLMEVGLATAILAPAWCAGAYIRATLLARRSNQNLEPTRSIIAASIAWMSWLGAYAVAWKWSIDNAITLYAALPTAQPGCYIATAAACGHRRFVGSAPVRATGGSIFLVNQQLRRLKCVEIAVATICPPGHRVIRRIYDSLGPPLARWIAPHPLAADLAFAALKPFEWVAFSLLIAIAPGVRPAVLRLYPAEEQERL